MFAVARAPYLRAAVHDLSWLLGHGYVLPSAVKLVGDRYALTERQRQAVVRCSCSDDALERRARRCTEVGAIAGRELWIDGYNVLATVESALGGGVLLVGRDGCIRDLAGLHGSFRRVMETEPALALVGTYAERHRVSCCRWLLDRPVGNSGRLAGLMRTLAGASRWRWEVELVSDPDATLVRYGGVIASADSHVLDRCGRWLNLAREVIVGAVPDPWLVDLSG